MKTNNTIQARILKTVTLIVSGTALFELVLAQFIIRMTRLSVVELTGITLFAFIIFGMVTLFAVTRMGDTPWGKLFAVFMNIITAIFAAVYLFFVLNDEIFFRNMYYVLNRQTQVYEILPLSTRIRASIPLAGLFLGTAVYFFSGLVIFLVMLWPGKNRKETTSEN